jgi:hypothetical protein
MPQEHSMNQILQPYEFERPIPGLFFDRQGRGYPSPLRTTFESVEKRQFASMESAYVRHGGMGRGDELAARLRIRSEQPISALARLIVNRSIVSFEWLAQTWIPIFQFDLQDMSVRPSCASVISELNGVFDEWELALWFAQPNVWLNDAAPVDLVNRDAAAVLQAARTDRFVARG